MMFAYNVNLNYSGNLIDFYDWDDSDNIVLVKKIPLFMVSKNAFNELLCNKVCFSEKFYNIINNKCELFDNKKETSFIVSDGGCAFGIKVGKNGECLVKSYLDISDESEIVELSNNLSVYKIEYNVIEYDYSYSCFTRKSKVVIDSINKYLKSSIKIPGKLEYLYYEWFNVCCNKILISDIYNELYESINSYFSEKHIGYLKELEELNVYK